jgi:hypothetical protein
MFEHFIPSSRPLTILITPLSILPVHLTTT